MQEYNARLLNSDMQTENKFRLSVGLSILRFCNMGRSVVRL